MQSRRARDPCTRVTRRWQRVSRKRGDQRGEKWSSTLRVASREVEAHPRSLLHNPQALLSPLLSPSTSESFESCMTRSVLISIRADITKPLHLASASIICNNAPLSTSESYSQALKADDVVKIQLGSHIDGYPAIAAETIVVGASSSKPVSGATADAIKAAYVGAEAAIRLLKPGTITTEVAKEVEKAIKEFDVKVVEGMQTNQVDKDVIDGKKKIVLNPVSRARSIEKRDTTIGLMGD